MSLSRTSGTERRVTSSEDHLVGESALEADIARQSLFVDDDPHRDAAGRADRRAIVIGVTLALLVHAATLAPSSLPRKAGTRRNAAGKRPWLASRSMVTEGQPAPAFTLTSDTGDEVSLDSFRGGPVVLYFYPKDDTPGCTAQACGIRDVWGEFEKKGAVVLGVSPDSPKKHAKFKDKYRLPFALLSDEAHEVGDKYDTWVEKSMYGKTYMGMERSTFVIDADGNVAKIMRKVKPADHADDVLAAL
jgi:thioredoxin-dependent peroxiredoxin